MLSAFCVLWSSRCEFAASLSSRPPLRRTREFSLCPITFLQPWFFALSALVSKSDYPHEYSGRPVPPSAEHDTCDANCKVTARTVISRTAVIATFFGILAVGILSRYFAPQPSRSGWVHTNQTVPFHNASLSLDTFRQPYLNLNGLY